MSSFELRWKTKPNIPKEFRLSDKFWDDIAEIVAAGIIDNIIRQRQADGSALKRNAASTLAAKVRKGLGVRSLVASKHRFVKGRNLSWGVIRRSRNSIVIGPMTEELKNLVRWTGQKGYTGYVGISQSTKKAMIARLRIEMERMLKGRS